MLSRVPLPFVAAIVALFAAMPSAAQEAPAPAASTAPAAAPAPTVGPVAGPGLPTLSDADGTNLSQRLITGTQATRCRPGRRGDGSIIVCGGREASEAERLPLRDQTDSARSTNDGLPRAPNVLGLPPCKGNGVCKGFGSVPPPMYYFDITALPEPPAGSDADRIAKGEIPAP